MTRLAWLAAGVALLAACGGAAAEAVVSGDEVIMRMFDNRFEYGEVRVPVAGRFPLGPYRVWGRREALSAGRRWDRTW